MSPPPASPATSASETPVRAPVGRTTLDTSQGEVLVRAEGGWAEVFSDGRSLGRTPLRTRLPVGTRRLRLLPYGQEPAQVANVTVEWGAVTDVVIRVPPELPPDGPAVE